MNFSKRQKVHSAWSLLLATSLLLVINQSKAFAPQQRPLLQTTYSTSSSTSPLFSSKSKSPESKNKGDKLSRPERKALERQKKERQKDNKNNKNFKKRNGKKKKDDDDHIFTLHSERVSQLTPKSTADEVLIAIKRAQNKHDAHDMRVIADFLIDEVDLSFAYGYRGSLLARLAVAALHMSEPDLAKRCIELRKTEHRSCMIPQASAAIVRGLLRVHDTDAALALLDDELPLPSSDSALDTPENQEIIKHRALSLCSVASRHFFEGEPCMAVTACKMLADIGPIVRESGLAAEELGMPWTRIIQGAAQCESGRRDGSVTPVNPDIELPCNLVYAVLNAMTTFPSDNNDETYEALSNALVRRILFITGAVDMDGCPEADRGEVVFIGRSNVGKSSLVNMVTNRKSLAYTSKRPGKTQQFNYFAVNDKVGREKEVKYGDEMDGEKDADSFYIVDVPGFGFARVPDKQKQLWSDFLTTYLKKRSTLRVLFHLIDARHGPTTEDKNIMRQISETLPRKQVKYVVVLTKADKNVKNASTKNSGNVSKKILTKLRETMKECGLGSTPTLLTSAETKLGRDEIWRYMKIAAEG